MKELIDKQLSLLEDTFELSSRNDEDEENVEEGNIFVESGEEEKEEDEQSAMEHVEDDSISDVAATKNIQIELIVLDDLNSCIIIFVIFLWCGLKSGPKWR